MKKLVVLLMVSLMATSAFALADEDANSIGVYFDAAGDNNSIMTTPGVNFNMYFILANPTVPALDAFEFAYQIVAPPGAEFSLVRFGTTTSWPLNAGDASQTLVGTYLAAAGTPVPTSQATVLTNWLMGCFAPTAVYNVFISPLSTPSIPGAMAIAYDGVKYPAGPSTGGYENPVAVINGGAPVSEEVSSFGGVKALFR